MYDLNTFDIRMGHGLTMHDFMTATALLLIGVVRLFDTLFISLDP